ncbi:MAG: Crp/Fnr family transcriptional regulator [Pseudonocardia sp.]
MSHGPLEADREDCRGFRDLISDEEWPALLKWGWQSLAANQLLYGAGDRQQDVSLIERGRAKVALHRTDGDSSLIAVRGPGDVVDEMAALSSTPRAADVRAVGELHVVHCTAAGVHAVLTECPAVSLDRHRVLAARLRHADLWHDPPDPTPRTPWRSCSYRSSWASSSADPGSRPRPRCTSCAATGSS